MTPIQTLNLRVGAGPNLNPSNLQTLTTHSPSSLSRLCVENLEVMHRTNVLKDECGASTTTEEAQYLSIPT